MTSQVYATEVDTTMNEMQYEAGSNIDPAAPEENAKQLENNVNEDNSEIPQESPDVSESSQLSNVENPLVDDNIQNMTPKNVTLNFTAEFDFDFDEKNVYAVDVQIPTGYEEPDGDPESNTAETAVISLFRYNDFVASRELTIYDSDIHMSARVDNDIAFLYNVAFDGYEQDVLFGDTIRNSAVIGSISDGDVYNIHLKISENDEAKYKDKYSAPKFSEDLLRINSGEYGESRAAEIEATAQETQEEPTESVEETTTEVETIPDETLLEPAPEQKINPLMKIMPIVIAVLLIGLGSVSAVFWIRKLREDDDD